MAEVFSWYFPKLLFFGCFGVFFPVYFRYAKFKLKDDLLWKKVETAQKSSKNEKEILACLSVQFNPSIYL